MRSFIRQYADGTFAPQSVEIMAGAFDDAFAALKDSKTL
jgi:hypothetical protein